MRRSNRGVTLLELCVVLAMTGVLLTVAAFAWRRPAVQGAESRSFDSVLREARTRAMRSGRVVSLAVSLHDAQVQLAVRPDGGVVADGPLPSDSSTVAIVWEAYATAAR